MDGLGREVAEWSRICMYITALMGWSSEALSQMVSLLERKCSNITQGREGASIGRMEEDAHQDSTHVIIEGE